MELISKFVKKTPDPCNRPLGCYLRHSAFTCQSDCGLLFARAFFEVSSMPSSFLSKPSPDAQLPDAHGRFGRFGGRFVPETLVAALEQLDSEYRKAQADPRFQSELDLLLRDFVGRPSPLYFARRLTERCGGAQIWFKREDLNHTGAHKINNTIGQALLTLRMGKSRVIAETGAGQHGVATATACAHFGIPCVVYMGEEDVRRQQPNVQSMKLLGAEIHPVTTGFTHAS